MSSPSTCGDLSLQLAQKYVSDYSSLDEAMREHRAIMKCCEECEALLRSGIEAYRWLRNAELTILQAAREHFNVPDDVPQAIDQLYRLWLVPCKHAEALIVQQEALGYPVENLDEFRDACEQVQKRIHAIEMYDAIDAAYNGSAFSISLEAESTGTMSM